MCFFFFLKGVEEVLSTVLVSVYYVYKINTHINVHSYLCLVKTRHYCKWPYYEGISNHYLCLTGNKAALLGITLPLLLTATL